MSGHLLRKEIKPFTSFRFVFAFLVFTCHLRFIKHDESAVCQWLYTHVMANGYVGVNFFFVLSGFVLAYSYQHRLGNKTSSKYHFIIGRIGRIYPLHLLTLFLALPTLIDSTQNIDFSWLPLISNLSLTHSFIPLSGVYFSFNGVAWSLSNELFFYIVFAAFSGFYRFQKWISPLVIAAAALLFLSMLVIPEHLEHYVFYINPLTRLADFIFGIMLFQLFKKKHAAHLSMNNTFWEVLACLFFLGCFVAHNYIPRRFTYSIYYWPSIGALLFVFAFQRGRLSAICSHRLMVYLGRISFGFYMFHQLVIRYFERINALTLDIDHWLIKSIIVFSVTLALAALSYRYFEKPLLRKLHTSLRG